MFAQSFLTHSDFSLDAVSRTQGLKDSRTQELGARSQKLQEERKTCRGSLLPAPGAPDFLTPDSAEKPGPA